MSVFVFSNKMNKERGFMLGWVAIEKRLDPFYYPPKALRLERMIEQHKPQPLRNFVVSMASGATPKTSESEKYYTDKANGIPFLRVQNLSPAGVLQLDDCKYINKETHENYLKRSQVSEGDLLVKITGVGRMAIASVAPAGFVGNTSQHLVVIKTQNKEVSNMLAAYLNTDIGEQLASRRTTGGTRPALDYPALRSIPVIFDQKLLDISQKAARTKQQKLQQARQLLGNIDNYLLDELGIDLLQKEVLAGNKIFSASRINLSGYRFDPKLYDNNTQNLRKAILNTSFRSTPLKQLVLKSNAGNWGKDESENPGSEYIKCLVIRATEFDNVYNLKLDNDRVKYRLIHKDKLAKTDIQPNDLLIEKSGGSPDQPVGRIAILRQNLVNKYQVYFSNFVHKIRVEQTLVLPEFLFCFLKTAHNIKLTDAMQSQTNGIRNLIMSNYFDQTIPLPDLPKQYEIVQHINHLKTQAKQLQNEAKEATIQAKHEVEQMILGEQT